MKICFLITGLGLGGAEKFLLNLVPKLKFDKFIISLMNLNELGKEIEKRGIKVYYLGLNKINIPLVILRFRKIIRTEKPSIIDTYLIHSNLFGRIFGKILGIERVISSIRSDYSEFRILKFWDKITQNLTGLYILNSKALINYIHLKNSVPMNKIKIIPNGIDLERSLSILDNNYDIRKELGLKNDNFIIVSVGRLIKDKNFEILIKALKYLNKNIFLVIIGVGPEKKALLNLLEKLNLKNNVFFLGKRKDVLNVINSSNLFVLPSLREGMSNALLEAMFLKKICIVSNIPQNKELIKDNLNGIIFNPKDEIELSKKIMKVYNNKFSNDLGQASFNLIKKDYNINKIIKRYESVIEMFYSSS